MINRLSPYRLIARARRGARCKPFLKGARCTRGATAVEFALVFPVFLLMVLGIIEIGRAMWIKSAIQFATEEAARYALVNEDETTGTIATYAATALTNSGLTSAAVTFTATQDAAGGVTFITVTGNHTFEPLVAFTGLPSIDLTASARTPQNN